MQIRQFERTASEAFDAPWRDMRVMLPALALLLRTLESVVGIGAFARSAVLDPGPVDNIREDQPRLSEESSPSLLCDDNAHLFAAAEVTVGQADQPILLFELSGAYAQHLPALGTYGPELTCQRRRIVACHRASPCMMRSSRLACDLL
jgi:hypothetical protein